MNGMHADAVDWSEKYAMHLKEENKEFSEELQILRGRSEDLVALQIHKIHVDMELEVALEDSKRMTNELEDFKIRDQTQVEQ